MALSVGPLHNLGESADNLRKHIRQGGGLQPGAVTTTGFKVTQNTSANLSVQIAAGWALVSTAVSGNGLYAAYNDTTITTLTGGTVGNASLPRVDSVVLKVSDKIELGSTSDGLQVLIRPGTPTAGATLDNRSGAPSVANGELLLADLLMPAAATTYVTANIRDRRTWARGARSVVSGTGAGDQTTTSTTEVAMTGLNSGRMEITPGNVVRITGFLTGASSATGFIARPRLVGAAATYPGTYSTVTTAGNSSVPVFGTPQIVAGGSYVPGITWLQLAAGTATLRNSGNLVPAVFFEELVGGYGDNQ